MDESNLEISDFKMAGLFWRKPFSKYIYATKSIINKDVWLTFAPFSYGNLITQGRNCFWAVDIDTKGTY